MNFEFDGDENRMKHKILVIDDEEMLIELLSDYFSGLGYIIFAALDGKSAMEQLKRSPDIILLDINMPELDGFEFCKRIRAHVSCPILFLSARITEQDKVNGLRIGGDDYITKPFSMKELEARIEAHLRREERITTNQVIASEELLVDLSQRSVSYQGTEILFSKKEFDIIEFLLLSANQVFDREHIYEAVWGWEAEGNSDVVKEHIRKIRSKLYQATGKEYIETVWGIGYKWVK